MERKVFGKFLVFCFCSSILTTIASCSCAGNNNWDKQNHFCISTQLDYQPQRERFSLLPTPFHQNEFINRSWENYKKSHLSNYIKLHLKTKTRQGQWCYWENLSYLCDGIKKNPISAKCFMVMKKNHSLHILYFLPHYIYPG